MKTSMIPPTRLSDAEERLGYSFRDQDLLAEALCHASTFNEGFKTNERLEFLGDSVLNFLASWFLFDGLKEADEGTLSRRRSHLVDTGTLAAVARQLKLEELLITGKGQDLKPSPKMQADLLEACIGGIFLDGGIEAAQAFVLKNVLTKVRTDEASFNDPKSKLQHVTLAKRLGLPSYKLVEAKGPAHDMRFVMEVEVDGKVLGSGLGSSKKVASQLAAEEALRHLGDIPAAKDTSPETAEE
jgi:ribonuclease-3